MFFEIKDLELHPIEFAEKFEPGAIDLGTDYRQVTPIESGGKCAAVALSGISVFDRPLPAIRMNTAVSRAETCA